MSLAECPGGAKKWQCANPCDVPYIVCATQPVVPVDLRIGDCDASCADECDDSIPAPDWGYLVAPQSYRKCPNLHRSCTAECCAKPQKYKCPCQKKSKSKGHCKCSQSASVSGV